MQLQSAVLHSLSYRCPEMVSYSMFMREVGVSTWIFQSTGFTATAAFLTRISSGPGFASGPVSTLRGLALGAVIQAALLLLMLEV